MINESGTGLFAFRDSEPDAKMKPDETRKVNRMTYEEAIESLYAHLLALRMDYVNCEDDEEREDAREIMNALAKAIKALEKQVPMKTTTQKISPITEYWCPSCGGYLDNTYDMRIGTRGDYCEWCGQAIDWSDE